MGKLKTLLLITLSILVTVSCQPEETELSSSRSQKSVSELDAYWPAGQAAFPLEVDISTSFDNNETDSIRTSADSWSDAVDNRVNFFDTTGTITEKGGSLGSYQDGRMGVYKLTSWPSALPNLALAVTQIFGLRKNIGKSNESIEISHADILVNYDYFSFSTNGGGGYDLETVLLHEFGHFLGLAHDNSSQGTTVMYPSVSRHNSNRTPLQKDKVAIASLYNIGGVVQAATAQRSIAAIGKVHEEDQGDTEWVVIQFELRADGSEWIKVNDKYVQQNKKCKH